MSICRLRLRQNGSYYAGSDVVSGTVECLTDVRSVNATAESTVVTAGEQWGSRAPTLPRNSAPSQPSHADPPRSRSSLLHGSGVR